MPNLQVENIDVQKLKVHDKNPKQHSKKQIAQIAKSITEFGFVSPILADEQFEIIAGHGRLAAAKTTGTCDNFVAFNCPTKNRICHSR
jgi:ParB-like chromosome segregation protein Spo0J